MSAPIASARSGRERVFRPRLSATQASARCRAMLRSLKICGLAAIGVIAVVSASAPARAESVLRIAMTAGDIPSWTGQPDQGFEAYRFVGYSLYDGLTLWDLSRSDKEVDIRPGLATKWYPDPKDPKTWLFELRRDVKFHDGCDWDAD